MSTQSQTPAAQTKSIATTTRPPAPTTAQSARLVVGDGSSGGATTPASTAYARVIRDLANLLADSGISIRTAARHAGIDPSYLASVIRGREHPTAEVLARLAEALNATLSLRLYPNAGSRIRDRWQAPMLETLLGATGTRWRPYPEAGVTKPDKGWIDLVLHEPAEHVLVCGEFQSELRRMEQLIRWQGAKARSIRSWDGWPDLDDEPRISQLLVVRRTRANLAIARDLERTLAATYPAHPDDALASLRGTSPWPGAALVWMDATTEGARVLKGRLHAASALDPRWPAAGAGPMT